MAVLNGDSTTIVMVTTIQEAIDLISSWDRQ